MKKKIVSCLLVAVMCTLIGSVAYADESGSMYRADNIKSHGTLQYEQAGADNNVLIASQDLIYLANEIDELEDSYKSTATDSLAVIGQTPASTLWADICSAIEHSQDVSTGTIADNLSKNKGAWVNGKYITGNGNDVNAAYSQGYIDGVHYTTANANISYVYHTHAGEQSGTGTGCYQGYHSHTDACYSTKYGWDESDALTGWDYGDENNWLTLTGKCYTCGKDYYVHRVPLDWRWEDTDSYIPQSHRCLSQCTHDYNAWQIVCGKTPGVTIESATITFP